MRRRTRPLVTGVTVATATSAAGVAVNVATEHNGSVVAWAVVAACTLVLGTITAAADRLLGPGPAPDRMADAELIIESEIRPDGSRVQRVIAFSRSAAELAVRRTPLPAPVLPPALSAALVTRRRSTGIARRLENLDGHYPGLQIRLCIDNDLHRRMDGLRSAEVVILDDHCTTQNGQGPPRPLVGGIDLAALRDRDGRGLRAVLIVLTCRDGGDTDHTMALRRSLDQPAILLSCSGAAPLEHRSALFPVLLEEMGKLAGAPTTSAEVCKAVDDALAYAQRRRPQMNWERWTASVIQPV